MKIYFSASISHINRYRNNYIAIVKALEKLGHNVIAEHVLKKKTKSDYEKQSDQESLSIQRKMTAWKKQADMCIFEVSSPSLGIGQEIAFALSNKKQVIALHTSGTKPHVLRDEGEESLFLVEYSLDKLEEILEEYIDYAKEHADSRFNFFISPEIQSYLDWIARYRRTPRAVYLRELLEKDIRENKDWKKQK